MNSENHISSIVENYKNSSDPNYLASRHQVELYAYDKNENNTIIIPVLSHLFGKSPAGTPTETVTTLLDLIPSEIEHRTVTIHEHLINFVKADNEKGFDGVLVFERESKPLEIWNTFPEKGLILLGVEYK